MEKKENDNIKDDQKRRVAALVKELIGDRSIRRTAEDTNVAASYITGITKGKYLPSADIIRKLTAPESKPQRGISQEDLMIAAGYQTEYHTKGQSYVEIEPKTNGDTARRLSAYREGTIQGIKAKHSALFSAIIYKGMAEKGMTFHKVSTAEGAIRGYKPDMIVYVPQKPVLEWWFVYNGPVKSAPEFNKQHMVDTLGKFAMHRPAIERKCSYVTDSQEEYEFWRDMKGQLSYRGDLSVILIDSETMAVMGETYVSFYGDEEDCNRFGFVRY